MRIVDSLHRRPISAFIHNERNWSIEQAVDTLGRIGYDGIDYGPIGAERPDTTRLQRLKMKADESGLIHNSMHYRDFGFGALADQQSHDAFLQAATEDLQIAGVLGCRDLAFHVADLPNRSNEQFIEANTALFEEVGRLAVDSGVRVCLENHYPTAHGRTIEELLAILDGLGMTTWAGICVDTGHAVLIGGNPAEMIRKAGPRLNMLHLHDNMGRQDTHLSVGLGVIDWFEVFAALDAVGFDGPLNLEIGGHHPHDEADATAQAGYHNLLQLLSEYYVIAEGTRKSVREGS